MKSWARYAGSLLVLLCVAFPATAAGDTGLERLATCRDSWLDWQIAGAPQLAQLAARLHADFTRKPGDAFLTPKKPVSLAGFRVLQLYPDSVGMGVGFSVLLAVPFDKAKAVFAKAIATPLTHCETGDGMTSCDHEFAARRTFMLMSSDRPGDRTTLAGCFYYYEK